MALQKNKSKIMKIRKSWAFFGSLKNGMKRAPQEANSLALNTCMLSCLPIELVITYYRRGVVATYPHLPSSTATYIHLPTYLHLPTSTYLPPMCIVMIVITRHVWQCPLSSVRQSVGPLIHWPRVPSPQRVSFDEELESEAVEYQAGHCWKCLPTICLFIQDH